MSGKKSDFFAARKVSGDNEENYFSAHRVLSFRLAFRKDSLSFAVSSLLPYLIQDLGQ